MPIHKVGNKWQWGSHGKKYSSRKGAERQAAAAHANGFQEEVSPKPFVDPKHPAYSCTHCQKTFADSLKQGMTKREANDMMRYGHEMGHPEFHRNEETITETLDAHAPASAWIHDFVHSDNPKFKGKSRKERIRMALGAYYGKQNEERALDEVRINEAYLEEAVRGNAYLEKHSIKDVPDLINHIANHGHMKKYHDERASFDSMAVSIPHKVLQKHTGLTKKHLGHLEKHTGDYEGSVMHRNGNVELWTGS